MLLVLTAVMYRRSYIIYINWEKNELSNNYDMLYTQPVHNKNNFYNLLHSIMIVICRTGPTASNPWFDAVNLLQF